MLRDIAYDAFKFCADLDIVATLGAMAASGIVIGIILKSLKSMGCTGRLFE